MKATPSSRKSTPKSGVKVKDASVLVSEGIGRVSVLISIAPAPEAVLVLAHGAGAGMTHRFLESLAANLATLNVTVIRYNFPYMENGRKRPDAPGIAEKTVEKVVEFARDTYPHLPMFAGGKSFGGRMTSQAFSKGTPSYIQGIVFYGFPLHPTGAPATDRAKHLFAIKVPMLFLQGTKDTLARPDLIEDVVGKLSSTARLEPFEGADHSFNRGKDDNIPLLAEKTEEWMQACLSQGTGR